LTLIPFVHAKAVGDRLIALLSELGIDPPGRSNLEAEMLSLVDLIDVWQSPSRVPDSETAGQILRAAAGLHDFAAKVLVARSYPEFGTLIPHLRLLAETKYPRASLLQNNRIWDDDTSRKMTELYVACLTLPIGYNLRLDHPVASRGDNPDVMFDLIPDDDGPTQEWAIAIKTISTGSGPSICATIENASRQIAKSSADHGLVLINLRDALDHGALYSPKHSFSNLDEALAALRGQVAALLNACEAARSSLQWNEIFAGKSVAPVLFLAQALVLIQTRLAERTPTPIKAIFPFYANQERLKASEFIAWHINNAMQITL